jgi:hypothetical protein
MDPADSQFHEGLKKRVMSLEEEKKSLERCLVSYDEAQEKKLDAKSEKQINMYIKEKTVSEEKMDKATATAEEVYDYALRMATEKRDKDIRMAEQAYEYALRKATEKRDKDRTMATTTYEKYRDYCNGHIERLGGSARVPDPERIIRKKKELLEIDLELSLSKRQLDLWEIVNKSDYVHKVVLPEKTWIPSPEVLAEEAKLKELRESWIPEPEY